MNWFVADLCIKAGWIDETSIKLFTSVIEVISWIKRKSKERNMKIVFGFVVVFLCAGAFAQTKPTDLIKGLECKVLEALAPLLKKPVENLSTTLNGVGKCLCDHCVVHLIKVRFLRFHHFQQSLSFLFLFEYRRQTWWESMWWCQREIEGCCSYFTNQGACRPCRSPLRPTSKTITQTQRNCYNSEQNFGRGVRWVFPVSAQLNLALKITLYISHWFHLRLIRSFFVQTDCDKLKELLGTLFELLGSAAPK